MKLIALLTTLLGMSFPLHAETSAGRGTLADEFLKTPRSSLLRRSAEQAVYLYATAKVKEGGRGDGMVRLRYPELSPVTFLLESFPDNLINVPVKVILPAGVTEASLILRFGMTARSI